MTNHCDIKNADSGIMGGNVPKRICGFAGAGSEGRSQGQTLVDPPATRSVPCPTTTRRFGGLGHRLPVGLIHYLLEHDKIQHGM